MSKSNTRIFVILARSAPMAVIFRRGPSKQVQLIKWHLGSDRLEYGQWFKGRIYERRCDLSPSGDLLLYFAAKYKEPLRSWTAISKPPYLTALAVWPKGDGWGGGGLFESELSVQLNHRPGEDVLAEGLRLRKNMRINLYGARPGWGEDFPIYHSLLIRNGWELIQQGKWEERSWKAEIHYLCNPPEIYQKTSKTHLLQMQLKGISQKHGPWYVIDYAVLTELGEVLFELPQTDWADWDGKGNLLFARKGRLFRLNKKNFTNFKAKGNEALQEITDLNGLKFEAKEAPQKATVW